MSDILIGGQRIPDPETEAKKQLGKRLVSLERFHQETGFSPGTVKSWVKHQWTYGEQFTYGDDDEILVSMKGFNAWARSKFKNPDEGAGNPEEALSANEIRSLPTELYRYFDAEGALLYVGISLSTMQRAGQHRMSAIWWGQAVRIDIERFATRAEAEAAEREAIKSECPLHNIAHAVGDQDE